LSLYHVRIIANEKTAWLGYEVSYEFEGDKAMSVLVHEAIMILAFSAKNFLNSYPVPGQSKNFGNLPNFIRINMPRGAKNKRNFLEIKLSGGGNVHGKYRCCSTRWISDRIMEHDDRELSKIFAKPFSVDTRCLIRYDQTCENCGHICDECGATC
jgi:hypothetical protein